MPALDPVRVAVLGNQTELLKAVQPKEANFQPVAVSESPDLVWDPVTLEVVTNGDVVARQIAREDLPGVIDRIAAINGFKRLATKAPQTDKNLMRCLLVRARRAAVIWTYPGGRKRLRTFISGSIGCLPSPSGTSVR